MLSRVFVARGINCLTTSAALVQHRLRYTYRNSIRMFSVETQPEGTTSTPIENSTVANVSKIMDDSVVNNTNEVAKETASQTTVPNQTGETKSVEMDKEFLENLLSSISVETKTEKQRKQLVFDFATIMMDPSFKQLYNSLSKSLPPQYFDDKGLLPTIKKEFIARIQEEIIQGSYLPLEPDPFLQGLKEKKKAMVKDNQIIQTAETDDEELSLPIPSWIWNEVMGDEMKEGEVKEGEMKEDEVKEGEVKEGEVKVMGEVKEGEVKEGEMKEGEMKEGEVKVKEEIKKKVKKEIYDPNKNNAIEEAIDTFGLWPFKTPETTTEPPKKRGEHHTGSYVTKNIIINKKGERIAYGGGKRKDAIARVYIRNGNGQISINGKSLIDMFPMGHNRDQVLAPLAVTLTYQKFDILANVTGGGTTGQSEAIRVALSKALSHYDPSYSVLLSKAGLLTADARQVERKKPGHRKARKPQQWVKR